MIHHYTLSLPRQYPTIRPAPSQHHDSLTAKVLEYEKMADYKQVDELSVVIRGYPPATTTFHFPASFDFLE